MVRTSATGWLRMSRCGESEDGVVSEEEDGRDEDIDGDITAAAVVAVEEAESKGCSRAKSCCWSETECSA